MAVGAQSIDSEQPKLCRTPWEILNHSWLYYPYVSDVVMLTKRHNEQYTPYFVDPRTPN